MSVILITGCSSGFGLNTAVRLAVSDHTIYASMRDLQKSVASLKILLSRKTGIKWKPIFFVCKR